MPRHKWMSDLVGNIIGNIGQIFEYAKKRNPNIEIIPVSAKTGEGLPELLEAYETSYNNVK